MGENPITYSEIDAYARLTKVQIEPWEARAIVAVYWSFRAAVPSGKAGVRNETDARDGAGVKALMSGLKASSRERRSGKGA